jgi:putative Mg2+ transporter-C (MgtC) family protein
MIDYVSLLEAWLQLIAAIFLGGLLGWERQSGGKPAGLRTHILVSLGAATFTMVASYLTNSNAPPLSGDPTRVIQGVITGIGFLGAGVIIHEQGGVHGLTTAASIWIAGALGAACGAGALWLAALTAVHALVVLRVLKVPTSRLRSETDENRPK